MMGQQQFQIRFSLGTKLLISIVLLLALVITFLDASTVFLVRDDKRAYVYDSQATTAMLAGREFVDRARHGIDTLRIALSTYDPAKPNVAFATPTLKAMVNNQTELLWVSIRRLDLKTGRVIPIGQAGREADLKSRNIELARLELAPAWLLAIAPELSHSGYAFSNLSSAGGPPLVSILVLDTKFLHDPAGVPAALGVFSLEGFGDEFRKVDVTLATKGGWVLYDTDPAQLYARANILDDPLFARATATQLAAGAAEFPYKGTDYLGSFVHPGLELTVLARTEWKQVMAATYTLLEKFILLGGMAVGVAVIFAILFSKTLSAPINRLYGATQEVAKGNFNFSLDARGSDEIAALTGSFNVMSRRISELMVEQARKLHLENELAIASTVQQTLIPPTVFKNENVFIRSHYQSADECGGDWWGYFGGGDKLVLMIADATGHGLPSALMTASARSCFSVMAKLAQEDEDFTYSPSAMLQFANRVIHDASMGKIMMTFFIGVVDFTAKTLTFASAGHNPPWLFRMTDGKPKLKSLVSIGRRLGEVRDVEAFEEHTVKIGAGDILLLYTDGLMEGKSPAGEMYGKKRPRAVVEAALDGGPEKIVTSLMADFLQHNSGKHLDDDVTLAVAHFFPGQGPGPGTERSGQA